MNFHFYDILAEVKKTKFGVGLQIGSNNSVKTSANDRSIALQTRANTSVLAVGLEVVNK